MIKIIEISIESCTPNAFNVPILARMVQCKSAPRIILVGATLGIWTTSVLFQQDLEDFRPTVRRSNVHANRSEGEQRI